jgi:hypothetical protein
MPLYVMRIRNGNTIFAAAENEAGARERVKDIGAGSEIVNTRELGTFAAQFFLADDGELKSILLDDETLSDLQKHEYPMLDAARAHSYADFGSSETDKPGEEVLYDAAALKHERDWDQRDTDLIAYAVQQERKRLA